MPDFVAACALLGLNRESVEIVPGRGDLMASLALNRLVRSRSRLLVVTLVAFRAAQWRRQGRRALRRRGEALLRGRRSRRRKPGRRHTSHRLGIRDSVAIGTMQAAMLEFETHVLLREFQRRVGPASGRMTPFALRFPAMGHCFVAGLALSARKAVRIGMALLAPKVIVGPCVHRPGLVGLSK